MKMLVHERDSPHSRCLLEFKLVNLFGLSGTCFGLRWFTPKCEVPLCGHATLASAAVLFNALGEARKLFLFLSVIYNRYGLTHFI